MPLTVYTLSNCDRCRAATKWLRAHTIAFTERPIRETPPSAAELRRMIAAQDGNWRRLFNVTGQEYRAQKLAEKLPTLSADEAVALLAANGSLVKRPFLIGDKVGLVGFDAAEWASALPSMG